MATAINLAYLAGIVDGEGYVGVQRVPASGTKFNASFRGFIRVSMCDRGPIELLYNTFGGSFQLERPNHGGKPIDNWQVFNAGARDACVLLLPYLLVKHQQANLVVRVEQDKDENRGHWGHGLRLDPARLALRETIYAESRRLNKRVSLTAETPIDILAKP